MAIHACSININCILAPSSFRMNLKKRNGKMTEICLIFKNIENG